MQYKSAFITSLIIVFLSLCAFQIQECDVVALKSVLKKELKPDFKYDSAKTSRFTYKTKKQMKEIEIPLFMGEKYKFLFNTEGLSEMINVEIYNKPIGHKKRVLLYKLDFKEGQNIYSFEPEKSRKMYLSYTIPKVEEANISKGCILMVLGYKMKTLKGA